MAKLQTPGEASFWGWNYFLGENDSIKIGHNTWAERTDNGVAIRLHATRVVEFLDDGAIRLNSGGYETVTTKDRINRVLPSALRVFQRDHQWFIEHRPTGNVFDFFDGVAVVVDGNAFQRVTI